MKNVFLDLGANQLQGLKFFIDLLKIDNLWEIHLFEPNPKIDLESLIKENCLENLNVFSHKKGIWIEDSTKPFKVLRNNEASVIEGIVGEPEQSAFWGCNETVLVEFIDFHSFLNRFTLDYNIFIKMDIEWAEYEVLEHMIKKGWHPNINSIWVEFHGASSHDLQQRSDKIIDAVKSFKTGFKKWV